MPRRPELARLTRRGGVLGLVAAAAAALVIVGPVQGAGESVLRAAATAWHAVQGGRPQSQADRRVIVVLAAPSLADRVANADSVPSPEEQRRWTAQVQAGQALLVSGLRERGIELRREFAYARTFNGFSALVDDRAVAELERHPAVIGLYPVRATYPASISGDALVEAEFAADGGRRADVRLPGFDGKGITIALLDTGVDRNHPFLGGRVLRGFDTFARDRDAAAEAHPGEPARLEAHATKLAGLLVGRRGPNGLEGAAPGAGLLPIRVLGWQETSPGRFAVVGRGDQLLAGLERAVDPDGSGDIRDAARVALAAVVEPYAAFPDSPESRAVAGATALGTLVVAAAGNDGRAGIAFGAVAAPASAPDALAVGALDARRNVLDAELEVRVGDETIFSESVPVLGAVAPRQPTAMTAAGLLGPTLGDPGRAENAAADGNELTDYFDPQGVSLVAGRAALVEADGAPVAEKARHASAAGAAALLVSDARVPAGGLDLDESTALPVLTVPAEAGSELAEALGAGVEASVVIGAAEARENGSYLQVAPFSSGGLAFDGRVRPDVVAPGVGLATAGAGVAFDGSPQFATATGSSAAAAAVAGAAALLAQARPDASAAELRSLLVGNARRLESEGGESLVSQQGAGIVDLEAAAAGEFAVEPSTLAFGRADAAGWSSTRTITVRNISTRQLDLGFGFVPDQEGEPAVTFAAEPAQLTLEPGASAQVAVTAKAAAALESGASGVFVVAAEGAGAVRLPWAVAPRPTGGQPLIHSVQLSNWQFKPSRSAPAVLAFRAGRVQPLPGGGTIEPVGVLDVELWTQAGERVGVLARLRNLLPGRYAFGLTGRGPDGKTLKPGTYVVRLRGHWADASEGETAPAAQAVFRIVP
jgi:subtilisin family serine protease